MSLQTNQTTQAFNMGLIVTTPKALALLQEMNISGQALLARHQQGDWGDLDPEDAELNDLALTTGDRLLSAYTLSAGKIWIITEANRSCTTLLLPEDY